MILAHFKIPNVDVEISNQSDFLARVSHHEATLQAHIQVAYARRGVRKKY